MESNLKDYLDDILPVIDDGLEETGVPIYERFFIASMEFVRHFVTDTSFDSKDEFIKSDGFLLGVVPLVNDWYYKKYGLLAKSPKTFMLKGLITIMNQPFCIKFPNTISIVETEDETAWMKFVDHLDSTEDPQEMIQGRDIFLSELLEPHKTDAFTQINNTVSKLRKISINLNTLSIDKQTNSMASSILGHFDKATGDIVSYDVSRVATACWEIHLAIEKTMKVFLKQETGNFPKTHSLKILFENISQCAGTKLDTVNAELIESLPKDAVNLRYAENHISMRDTIEFYIKGLTIVEAISDKLDRDIRLDNASILIKMAPWAK
ncbi:HEPN domain-containing protein [Photobacterium halotolerans]|uniref:HEPN domain-containing protein n=1 Tax=Photobacterium halotolerans TaxID=265726 RepID=A0A0F5VBJ0_9GAMM|nr:HEPN domain-containing protein [Photobacterium halotolerans]KKC98859.1 hypothetical protein KY46_16160 [Photobacterium halotolerans]